MKLDDVNLTYFLELFKKFKNNKKKSSSLRIIDGPLSDSVGDCNFAYPTAIASDDLMKELPYVEYEELQKNDDLSFSENAVVWIKKMQAGTGSSLVRNRYIADLFELTEDEVNIGAKGTDLYIKLSSGELISLAEAQILQAFYDSDKDLYSKIILHDIIGTETEKSISEIWNNESLVNHSKTYKELITEGTKVKHFGHTFQNYIPTINESGSISFNRIAPGGHALFGIDAILAAVDESKRPSINKDEVLIGSIGNGEDLSSSPDSLMINWMIQENIPIAMVTTTKTDLDLKGGQIALVKKGDKTTITIIEKAQAEESGQLELFEQLGLRDLDNKAFFNTNMVLINYNALVPKINKIIDDFGHEVFLSAIAPDLIQNEKKQKDSDGVERSYTQLEGAMGSVVLNLDKFWRENYDGPLVHFLNVGKENRTKFFSPIKTAFDFFVQFNSDRFKFDVISNRLINNRPGKLPKVSLKSSTYKDLSNTLNLFEHCNVLELDSLTVEGDVSCRDLDLRGNISIKNKTGKLIDLFNYLKETIDYKELKFKDNRIILENTTININNEVTRKNLNSIEISENTL